MTNDRNETGLVLFLTGLALGAIAGILLAPDSGRETRRKVLSAAQSLKEKASEEFHEELTHLKTDIPRASHRYNEAVRAGWKAFLESLEKERDLPPASEG